MNLHGKLPSLSRFTRRAFAAVLFFFLLSGTLLLAAQPGEKIAPAERCPVCGMFVGKYPQWLCQIVLANGKQPYFDGVKDLLAFYFDPGRYGVDGKAAVSAAIRVKDYYTLEWLDGRKAFYVTGSDVLGPMGHEFIPFASQTAAENFRKDHKGARVLRFEEITPAMVDAMRHGQRMR